MGRLDERALMAEEEVKRQARIGRYIMAVAFCIGALLAIIHG